MIISPVTLEGLHVKLTPMNISHLDGLYEALVGNNRWQDIWKYRVDKVKNKEDLKKYMEVALAGVEKKEIVPFIIFDKVLNKIVGTTRLADISLENKSLEIGWTSIAPEVMRSRVNTECKYLLLTHCFETLRFVRVALKTLSINERSQKAILRIGAKKEGELRWTAQTAEGEYVNTVYFSIIQPEWPGVKKKLAGFLAEK
ncbi:MAG: GNAT family N-acetyltransferase [Rhodospirillaceae bacterium]|nr:GNAT family N-acetyltransferase [Rhodospirillaceae bacterium]